MFIPKRLVIVYIWQKFALNVSFLNKNVYFCMFFPNDINIIKIIIG